jgi:hypothetical protein
LAKAVGAELSFESKKNRFLLSQKFDLPKTQAKELSLLLSQIASWIMAKRRHITKVERERIVRVVKALIE